MSDFALFTGGVRSGKTALACQWAQAKMPAQIMLATCHAQDAEMEARIAAHKKARGQSWTTLEEPLDPLGALAVFSAEHADFAGAVVLDSLGMWIANLMGQNMRPHEIMRRAQALANSLAALPHPCAVVSEECGLGFLPADPVARKFGDLLGKARQILARRASLVIFASCGLPLALKGQLP